MSELALSHDVVVVANKNNPLSELTKQQIIDIFMGRTKFYASGHRIVLLDQKLNSTTRKTFYFNLVKKTLNEINSYRARLLFSGRFLLQWLKSEKHKIVLENGSLLIMSGKMQHNWLHQIPKTKKTIGERINLTFRRIY